MEDYRIKIIAQYDGVYSNIKSFEEAQKIAEEECTKIYTRLDGRCDVEIESIGKC